MNKKTLYIILVAGLFIAGYVFVIYKFADPPGLPVPKEFRPKSISEYYSLPADLTISEERLDKTGAKEILHIYSGKAKEKNYYEITMLTLYSDKNWQDGNEHDLYVEILNDAGFMFYGPIKDNPAKIIQQLTLFTKKDFIVYDQEFLRYEVIN